MTEFILLGFLFLVVMSLSLYALWGAGGDIEDL